jgi:hypothetical protein
MVEPWKRFLKGASMLRRRIAAWLDPEMARKADRYDRLVLWIDDRHWLTKFPDAYDAMTRLAEMNRDYWRPIEAPATGTLPHDMHEFRERLRRRSSQPVNT